MSTWLANWIDRISSHKPRKSSKHETRNLEDKAQTKVASTLPTQNLSLRKISRHDSENALGAISPSRLMILENPSIFNPPTRRKSRQRDFKYPVEEIYHPSPSRSNKKGHTKHFVETAKTDFRKPMGSQRKAGRHAHSWLSPSHRHTVREHGPIAVQLGPGGEVFRAKAHHEVKDICQSRKAGESPEPLVMCRSPPEIHQSLRSLNISLISPEDHESIKSKGYPNTRNDFPGVFNDSPRMYSVKAHREVQFDTPRPESWAANAPTNLLFFTNQLSTRLDTSDKVDARATSGAKRIINIAAGESHNRDSSPNRNNQAAVNHKSRKRAKKGKSGKKGGKRKKSPGKKLKKRKRAMSPQRQDVVSPGAAHSSRCDCMARLLEKISSIACSGPRPPCCTGGATASHLHIKDCPASVPKGSVPVMQQANLMIDDILDKVALDMICGILARVSQSKSGDAQSNMKTLTALRDMFNRRPEVATNAMSSLCLC